MPANQTDGPKNWSPKPDFARAEHLELAPDPRVFEINNVGHVALALQETSWELAAYDFMPEIDVHELALESARKIIEDRSALLESRLQGFGSGEQTQPVEEGQDLKLVADPRQLIRPSRISA